MTDVGYAGLDFGTSNSSIGSGTDDGVFLIEHGGGGSALPSAVFFAMEERRTLFGQDAIESYRLGDEGRLLRAMKSVLGTSLMDAVTHVGRERVRFPAIIGSYIGHLREALEARCGERKWSVVVGRPFRFVDDDDAADTAAQSSLEAIVRDQGFEHVEFQFEPIAAALAHERTLTQEEQVLVVDIGGGTADFSIVRVSPEAVGRSDRRDDVLATSGVHIGGNDFDRLLSLASAMPALGYGTREAQSGRTLPIELELASGILRVSADRAMFDAAVGDAMHRIDGAVDEAMQRASLSAGAIDTVFMTGGSSSIPVLVETVRRRLPGAHVKHGDDFGSVGLGLVLDARARFGD